jgi:deoxyribodipyrimidine photo-lyase
MPALVWFRRDLRIDDNAALYHAAKQRDGVVGLFIVTPDQWKEHDECPGKVAFWLNNLKPLSDELATKNIPLLIKSCDNFKGVPDLIADVCSRQDCDQLFFNREYEVNEQARDSAVVQRMQANEISVNRFHDRVLVPPREIETGSGGFYSVFTPYRKVWDERVDQFSRVFAKPDTQPKLDLESSPIPAEVRHFQSVPDWIERYPAGESEAQRRLQSFAKRISDYNEHRDHPSIDGTSELSPYLAAGVISPRQCLEMARQQCEGQTENKGAEVWISEITWRDFYTHVMVGYPRVSKHQPYKQKTGKIKWRDDKDDFQAWCEGRTGYPIVDAGMRQLNQTGWMHNRLRMVVAMFLSKNLLIDWRQGEQYFMTHLIDGDLAANNGGWQWSASTGTDSVPYFRLFNPFSQSERFDKEGTYIKQYCPELQPIPAKALHDPKKLARAIEQSGADYPSMIVEYKRGRERALAAFKEI